ncbi:MAG: dUTP diphosphatase [Limnochordales bacterium]|nr:dUTP diphosphatase [Limnochordales bacterium]
MSAAGERQRGFAVARGWEERGVRLPQRRTPGSAGYDLEAAETVTIRPGERAVIPTGLKAYMPEDEFLAVYIRSSLAFKYGLMLVNSVGIIDSDYFENPDNDGHIMIGVINLGSETVTVHKGDRVAQAIFQPFRRVSAEEAGEVEPPGRQRTGGIGSTGR